MLNSRKLGNYKNPYEFRRYWNYKKERPQQFLQPGRSLVTETERERFLAERLQKLESQIDIILQQSTTSKGKGRGKKSTNLLSRIRNSFSNQRESDQASQASTSSAATNDEEVRDDPPPYTPREEESGNLRDLIDAKVWVRKVQLLLNGSPLDQLDTEEQEDEAIRTYFKMMYNSGFSDGLFSNGISYSAFR